MLFTSFLFVVFFLAVLLVVCCIRTRTYQHLFLLAASLYFFWASSHFIIVLLLIAVIVSYYSGAMIHRSSDPRHRKIILGVAAALLLGILGYFKYYNFGISAANTTLFLLFNVKDPLLYLNIILPIGISFYTFQALSYPLDIYRHNMYPAESLQEYALYVTYFPQLVAGPIVRAIEFLPQLKKKVVITPENLRSGLTFMAWGFFKKLAIADNLAPVVNATFSNPVGAPSAVIMFATFLFGIQIFCDFSGYTDIAIGAARMMDFQLPINFDRPYLSRSPTEFWHKWHITLSRFVRDFLYIPLGGNRKGVLRTHFNLIVTWLACGLWHGASWNFVAWGGYHGVLLSAHKLISSGKNGEEPGVSRVSARVWIVISLLVTQYFVFLGWLIFRVGNLEHLKYCLYKFVIFDFNVTPGQQIFGIGVLCVVLGLFVISLHPGSFRILWNTLTFDHIGYLNRVQLKYWALFVLGIVIAIIILGPNATPQFIYFQF